MKFGFRLKNSRLPTFYLFAIGIAVLDWLLYRGYTFSNYTISTITGIAFWVACILAIHQVKVFIEKSEPKVIYHTIIAFFVINALVSFAELTRIIIESGAINPYRYQGAFQKYFINTGDYIKGISFDTCTTNAIINTFGIVFFLSKKNIPMVLLCMVVLLLTASNLVNLLLLLIFIFLFIFQTNRDQKSILIVCTLLLVVFLAKISPQNNDYGSLAFQKAGLLKVGHENASTRNIPIQYQPDSILNEEEKKQKFATLYIDSLRTVISRLKKANQTTHPSLYLATRQTKFEIPKANIHTPPYQHRHDTDAIRQKLLGFISDKKIVFPTSYKYSHIGKIISFQETFQFLYRQPLKAFLGNGIGNFSSKLAFRTTGLKMAGSYPGQFRYINQDFLNNHLKLWLFYFSADKEKHSIINNPSSVYNQLAGEYGFVGALSFLLLYVGFFIKDYRKLSYGIPLMILLLGFFFMDYWFEQLSIVLLFELLFFLNQKETKTNE